VQAALAGMTANPNPNPNPTSANKLAPSTERRSHSMFILVFITYCRV
jgi:hypothetical protein